MNEQHKKAKKILKIVGITLIVIGAGFAIAGITSFFIAFGSQSGMPKYFWMAFIGLPLLAIGSALTVFGYHKEITKYVKNESAPVVKELYGDLSPEFSDLANKFNNTQGKDTKKKICTHCGTVNDFDDKFCKKCGKPIEPKICPKCGAICDDDSVYCQKCGTKLD